MPGINLGDYNNLTSNNREEYRMYKKEMSKSKVFPHNVVFPRRKTKKNEYKEDL